MPRSITYQYYVEGSDEKKIVDTLKKDLRCIRSGKVEVFNVIQNEIKKTRIRTLKKGTVVILVYDTDIPKTDVLKKNIDQLNKERNIGKVICIPQVYNLEDELKRACGIKDIKKITNSKSNTDFKRDLIQCNNLDHRLVTCNFNIEKFWIKIPDNDFEPFGNDEKAIKL